jgi:hypothetical protein
VRERNKKQKENIMKTENQIEGLDVNLEISLKEYGLAWKENENGEFTFIYGISYNGEEYGRFSTCDLSESDIDWISEDDMKGVLSFVGMSESDWKDAYWPMKVSDLVSYFGTENIFGSNYWEGLTYDEAIA